MGRDALKRKSFPNLSNVLNLPSDCPYSDNPNLHVACIRIHCNRIERILFQDWRIP